MLNKKDPVCHARVKKNKAFCYEYKGKMYYFDSFACRNTFKEDPKVFINQFSIKKLLSRFLKEQGSVPKCCHEIKKRIGNE